MLFMVELRLTSKNVGDELRWSRVHSANRTLVSISFAKGNGRTLANTTLAAPG